MKAILLSILVLLGIFSISDVHAQRAKDGNYTVTGATEVLNTYTNLTVNASVGATSITVANNAMTGGAFGATALQQGDIILIVQMHGAVGDVNFFPAFAGWGPYTLPNSYFNSDPDIREDFGAVDFYVSAGRFERHEVLSVSGGNTINLTCGITYNFNAVDEVQIIRIPRFDDLTVNAGASIVPDIWDGTTGGVVALEVDGDLTLNAGSSISASGYGFRGGQTDNDFTPGAANTGGQGIDRFLGSPSGFEGSEKGEGIVGYHVEYDAIYSRYGVAAIANGGGGGGYVNSGGGGGSNVEIGAIAYNGRGNPVAGYAAAYGQDPLITNSSGGGFGGYALSQSNQNANFTGPNNAAWNGDGRKNSGGWGGHSLAYDAGRIFFGGGGGAGDQDSGQGGDGGRGGGIVYILNYGTISGGGGIEANGGAGENSNPTNSPLGVNAFRGNDGAGGGGGGGTVYIENAAAIPASVSIDAIGGDGGNQNLQVNLFQTNEAGGPGGAGSGGVIRYSAGTPTTSVVSGTAGTTTSTQLTEFPPNGATNGSTGVTLSTVPFYDLIPNDVTICTGQTATPSVTVVGAYTGTLNWYTSQYGGTPIAGQTNQLSYSVSPGATTTYWVGVCPGSFRVPVTVTVTASPNLTITDPAAVCAPSVVDITVPAVTTGSDPGTLTYWQNAGATITEPTPTAVGTGTYYIQLDIGGGCTAIAPVTVTVNPAQDATFASVDYCESSTNVISGVITPGGTYAISSQTGSGGVTIAAGTGVLSGGVAGDQVTIEYTTPGPCANSSTVVVNVLPDDDPSFTTGDFCVSSVNTISGIATPSGTFSIASQTGSGGVTINPTTGILSNYFAGDQVTIEYTTPAGPCQGSSTQVVNVTNADDASFTTGDFCASAVNTVSGIATPGGSFSITSQTGSGGVTINTTSGILSNYFAGDQVTIEYETPAGPCQGTSSIVVNVLTLDDATFNYAAPAYCVDDTDPTPTISGLVGGTFSSTAGLSLTAGTGVIDVSASAPGTYTVTYTTSGPCTNTSNQVVTINDLPVISAVSPVNVCGSNNVVLSATAPGAGYTFDFIDASMVSVGSGTVAGNTSTLNIGALAAGTYNYSATITDPVTGCSSSAPIVVNVTAPDDATFNYGALAYCQEGADPTPTITGLAGGTFSSTVGLSLTAGTGEIDLSASTPGTYTVTYTTIGTCPSSSNVSVTIDPTPTISGATSICPGASATLTGSGTPDATTPWTSSNTTVATVDNAGNVSALIAGTTTITYLDANGCSNTYLITVSAAPVLDPVTNVTACDSFQLVAITGTGLTGNQAYYSGVGGTGTQYNSGDWISTSTTIYVNDVSNPCTVEQSFTITVNSSPTISGGTSLCASGSLALSATGTPAAVTPWSSSNAGVATVDNAGNVAAVSSGTTDITYTDANGCSNTITVTVNPTPTISGNAPICAGATNTLTGSGTPDATTPWTSSNTAVATIDNAGVVTAVSTGTATITYLDANGCSTTEVVTVVVAPNLVITDPTAVCDPATVDLTVAAVTAGSDPGTLTYWTDNAATITLPTPNAVVTSNTYFIQLDDGNCTSIQPVTVTINPLPTIVLTDPAAVCDPALVDLTDAAVTTGSDPGTFTYFDGMGTAVPTPTAVGSGIYFITLTDANGCQSAGQVTATINPSPNLVVSNPSPVCEPNTIDLTGAIVTAGSDPGTLTYWTDAGATTSLTVPTAVTGGTYYIQLDDGSGCTSVAAVVATVDPIADASFVLTPTCDGATVTVTGTAGGTFSLLTPTSASIDPFTGTITGAAYNEVLDVQYSITGICPNSGVEMIVVDDCTPEELIIPTAFTPGTDGAHDTWEIMGLDNLYPNSRVTVYNRWGNKVFEHNASSSNPYNNNKWDGTFNGAQLPVASYYYIIETNDANSTEKYEGTVTILQ